MDEYNYISSPMKAVKLKKIRKWLGKMGVKDYSIDNETLEIDVHGDVYLNGSIKGEGDTIIPKIKDGKLPEYIRFRYVEGSFNIYFNNLFSLRGCPIDVGGEFDCSVNNLQSLEGCPERVLVNFRCQINQLETLEHCPLYVGGDFDASANKINTLRTGHNEKPYIGGYIFLTPDNRKCGPFDYNDVLENFQVKGKIYINNKIYCNNN